MFEKQFLRLDSFCAFLDSISVLMLLEMPLCTRTQVNI